VDEALAWGDGSKQNDQHGCWSLAAQLENLCRSDTAAWKVGNALQIVQPRGPEALRIEKQCSKIRQMLSKGYS